MPRLLRTALRSIPSSTTTSALASAPASVSRTILSPLARSSTQFTPSTSASASLARPTLTSIYRSIRAPLSLLTNSSSSVLTLTNVSPFPRLGLGVSGIGMRHITMGTFYQPSQRKRKRKHGFLVRLRKGANSRKMLYRRIMKGRKNLSH